MAAINEYIQQIDDPALRQRIQEEVDKLTKQKKFGLVFEEHLPERTPLYDLPIKKGSRVALKAGEISNVYTVINSIIDGKAVCFNKDSCETQTFPIEDLVCVAEFGEPIYPYLKPIDSVCNAPDDSLWHTLIQADNYHALQLLQYLYAGKADCIYIDPPYNTGARDWKYNNDYVDGNDSYRHSKWLSFMEKRLRIAKKLLNPKDSVLIVTIDEKEYLHLGCLLEEIFSDARIQMVTSVINPSGVPMKKQFARAEEYLFYIFIGDADIVYSVNDMLHPTDDNRQARWQSLLRSGNNSAREARPNLFYPVFFNAKTGAFAGTGDSLKLTDDKESIIVPEDCFVVWPTKANGNDGTWQLSQNKLAEKVRLGYVKYGPWQVGSNVRTISYLAEGMQRAVENGEIEIIGRNEDGTIITGRSNKTIVPLTVWNQPSHSAGDFGSSLLKSIFNDKRFTFPKSIYAEKDTIRFVVADKPNALVIDFFAGSGTTLHAVNLLNAEDGGHRRCIMVTNNEVSEAEAKNLSGQGYRPGDDEWEKLGIAQYVTWPRTVCSIEGHDINGNPLKGNYIGNDIPMADGFKANAAFFKLGFLDKTSVALGRQFRELLPLLWLKAGSIGPCPVIDKDAIPNMLILPKNHFAVLVDEASFAAFEDALDTHPEIDTVYLVTDYDVNYRAMANSLKVKNTYQLYRDYLDNFRINQGRN